MAESFLLWEKEALMPGRLPPDGFEHHRRVVALGDKERLLPHLQGDPFLHLYSLGDLDDFFFASTRWYALEGDRPVFLLYTGANSHTLLALERGNPASARTLLAALAPALPARLYCHLSPGLDEVLRAAAFALEPHGLHLKMKLAGDGWRNVTLPDGVSARTLTRADLSAIMALYAASYPGNWFEPHMLNTAKYLGLFDGGVLTAIAGVHVYSEKYDAAALGNITTLPNARGRGYGTALTGLLVKELRRTVTRIGLNVKADNTAAIRAYQKVGFEIHAEYEEYTASR